MNILKNASFFPALLLRDIETMPESDQGRLMYVEHGEGPQLTLRKGLADPSHSITLKAEELKPYTKYMILYSPLHGLVSVDHDEMFKSKDQWAFRAKTEVLSRPLANFYFHDTWENSALFVNCQPVSDLGFQRVDKNTYIHDWFEELYGADDYHIAHNTNERMEAFRSINTIDSVIALEQQNDLLLQLVASLINGDTPPDWAGQFIANMQEHSCTKLKDVDAVVADVTGQKAAVRAAQAQYLSKRKQRV